MNITYSDDQLTRIRDQAMIYQCACPAQVCVSIVAIRDLHAYQARCMDRADIDRAVHERITATAELAHAELERCLTDVLGLEGWDLVTLTMPAILKERMLDNL